MKKIRSDEQSSMILPDGRQLSFVEYGFSDGNPIFYFHGLPGSRLDVNYLKPSRFSERYRFIAIDRPGIGLSSFDKHRSILSWVDDVEALANHLKIERFSIISHSAGAPFAAVCAYKIPYRLIHVAIVSGMGPFEIPEVTASLAVGQRMINRAIRVMPWIATAIMTLLSFLFKKPFMLEQILKQLPEVDRDALQVIDEDTDFRSLLLEPFKHGVTGIAEEMNLTLQPWGFNIEDIRCPVTIWQGGLDKQAPLTHAKIYSKLIPKAKLMFFEKEGHTSLLVNQAEEILRSVSSP